MIDTFKTIQLKDYDVSVLQDNVANFARQLVSRSLLDGQLLMGISVASGTNNIPHKLGRDYQGYIIVSLTSPVTIYELTTTNTSKQTTLQLSSSGAATIGLWVF